MTDKAAHAREMAELSRVAGRSLSFEETNVVVQQSDDRPRELALFAGSGGGILGGHLLGWRCVCAVEIDAYAASVLIARQNDGTLEPFPIWDDVRTFDGRPWRGRVDVVSGGFPCQDISVAGKGAGLDGKRSGLWREFARIIGEVRPEIVFVENSPALVTRGLDVVLGDLAALGFDAQWGVVSAENSGAPHKRERIWIVAHANSDELWIEPRRSSWANWESAAKPAVDGESSNVANASKQYGAVNGQAASEPRRSGSPVADATRKRKLQSQGCIEEQRRRSSDCSWWDAEPDVGRVVDGCTSRVDRLRCLGNGQVPAVARLAFEILSGEN